MRFDGVIFDLDGTLWDSTLSVAGGWNQSLERQGLEGRRFEADDIAGIMGLTQAEIAEKLFCGFGEKGREICKLCIDEEKEYIAVHGGSLYSGIEEMLRGLSEKASLFIVSNCEDGYIECFLDYTGFRKYFTDWECIGVTGLNKGENIRLVCKRNMLKNPVYVGDTASDEKSARAAECPFVHAGYGFGSALSPDGKIEKPLELIKLLENM